MSEFTTDQLQQDIRYLLARSARAGSFGGDPERDVGISSNSMVSVIYGETKPEDQRMPNDHWDYLACKRAFDKLPDHRKTDGAFEAAQRAYEGLPDQYKARADQHD
jgi:hypothetical protein